MYKENVKTVLGEQLTSLNKVGGEISTLVTQGQELIKNVTPTVATQKNQELMATYDLVYAVTNLLHAVQQAQGVIENAIGYADGVETL